MLGAIVPVHRLLKNEKFDVLVTHLTYVNLIVIFCKLFSFSNTKLFVVEHCWVSDFLRLRSGWVGKVLCQGVRLLYPFADKVIAVSDLVKDDLRSIMLWNPKKVRRLYFPLWDKAPIASPEFPDVKGLNGCEFILGVGRLDVIKQFPLMIEAFSKCSSDLKLVIAGEGEERKKIVELIVRKSLQSRVMLVGFRQDLSSLFFHARALVITSQSESLSNIVIEALYWGCPVVTVKCGGPEELINSGGLGVVVNSLLPEEVAAAMESSSRDEINQTEVEKKISPFQVEKSTANFIKELISED